MLEKITRSAVAGVLLATWASPLMARVNVEAVRISSEADETRVVVDLSGSASHTVFTLQAPDRVVIDLRDARLERGRAALPEGRGVVRRVRAANRGNGDARLVLDLAGPAQPRSFLLPPGGGAGHRLVVDLAHTGTPVPAAAPASPVKRLNPLGGARDIVVAIDPGHGGKDPGATGRRGTREKDVVLQIARRLKARIDAEPGMRAHLTREGDTYLMLRERIARAREMRADLFLSVHADAFRHASARGSSVFVLSARGASDEAAAWLAERENAADLVGGVTLEDKDPMLASVLLDLSQTATLDASGQVAQRVLGELGRASRLHKGQVQRAGFVVLKSPDIPSILVETAFISNPDEERLLTDLRHQEVLSQAILNGIVAYFRDAPPPGTLMALHAGQPPRGATKHVVVSGDTLSDIASRYRVSVGAIRRHNRLAGDRIRVGQVLQIPATG